MDLCDEFLDAVPESTRSVIETLLRESDVAVDVLRRQVREHTTRFAVAAARDPALDPGLAQRIEDRCLQLLDRAERDDSDALRRIVQATCEYYVYEDDADGDFDSVEGLDDDIEVVNAALFVLGLDELSISLP